MKWYDMKLLLVSFNTTVCRLKISSAYHWKSSCYNFFIIQGQLKVFFVSFMVYLMLDLVLMSHSVGEDQIWSWYIYMPSWHRLKLKISNTMLTLSNTSRLVPPTRVISVLYILFSPLAYTFIFKRTCNISFNVP
jgi:hypothetical protein